MQRLSPITYRSSTHISGVEATAKFDEAHDVIEIIPDPGSADIDTTTIKIEDIEAVKAKDYLEDDTYCWVVALHLPEGKQVSLEFRLKELMDSWCSRIKSHTAARANKGHEETASKKDHFSKVVDVELIEPEVGILAMAKVGLDRAGKATSAVISVPGSKHRPEDVKAIVHEFAAENEIFPAERTPLYRFLRTLVQRARMETETSCLVEEIHNNSLESLLQKKQSGSDDEELANKSISDLKIYAENRLKTLKESVQRRLGDGTGAELLASMIMQNIDKMLNINDLSARFHQADGHTDISLQ